MFSVSSLARRCLAPLVLFCLAGSASAQAVIDTLSKIRNTKTIVLGVREAARPFSFVDARNQHVGYAIDLCLNAVDEIKKELKLNELKVQYKLVTGPERIPKLLSGEIDLECGSTTNTRARQEQVAFSYTYFVAAMRVLAPKNLRIDSLQDLNGLKIALSKGTTSEKLFMQLAGSELKASIESYGSNTEAYAALKEGKVNAFPQDDSLLLGLAASDRSLDAFDVSPLALSVEPYAVMMRKGDVALRTLVDRRLARLYASGDIDAIYARWFATDALTIKMGRLTRDSFTRPNREAGVAMLLGYSI